MLRVALILLFAAAKASATDPFVGTWVLNPALSKYPVGTCPKRMVIEMESRATAFTIAQMSRTQTE